MGLRDLLKKKDQLDKSGAADPDTVNRLAAPEFTFIRSDTFSQEVIHPPTGPARHGDGPDDQNPQHLSPENQGSSRSRGRTLDVFKSRSRSASVSSQVSTTTRENKRLSDLLHLSRSPVSSDNVPSYLPEIVAPADGTLDKDGTDAQWEKRATMLARENEKHRSRPSTPVSGDVAAGLEKMRIGGRGGASGADTDADIQEAIRLHEEGDLENSTRLFAKLADPNGANNPLSQVLYGLALRHGWGCTPDTAAAVNYLSKAASNSAMIESAALQRGLKKGGAAKGELVLAIFELANCFRHGWGIPKDAIAAKQYYETAANLGDTDAMNEIGWCYLEGFGTKKDKFAAAKYYRLAEQNGNKTLGNTWIWKEKYDPDHPKK